MSKKINLKKLNLDAINPYFVACNDLVVERNRYNKAKSPLVDERAKLLESQEKERINKVSKEQIDAMKSSSGKTIFELNRLIEFEEQCHKTINKGINARKREVVRQYCPKEDDMYLAYSSINNSDVFASLLLEMLKGFGTFIRDPKMGAKQLHHITGWRNRDGKKVPESRTAFTNSIFCGIKTMLLESLCVENADGSLSWKEECTESE